MLLQIQSTSTDLSDFWRPRLTMRLEAPRLSAGLHRLCLKMRRPGYATLRLMLEGWSAPMTVFLDRIGSCVYAKSFSIPRPVASMELEIEPHLDAGVVISVDIEPLGLRALLHGRRARRHLASPRTLALKVRQVMSGRSALAFTSSETVDAARVYESWQAAFEGESERERVAAELWRLSGAQTPILLEVPHDGANSLGAVLDAAERAGAIAFAILDRPGRWHAQTSMMMATEMLRHPDSIAVYGDSDRLDGSGRRGQPDFKPAWSPRLQLGTDYVRSAVAFRVGTTLRKLAAELPGPATSRVLLAKLAEAGQAGAVRHIPRVVFHEAAANAHAMSIEPVSAGTTPQPSVSVIMPTRDNPRLLHEAVRSVLDEPLSSLELIIVDNGSKEPAQLALLDELCSDPRVRLVRDPRAFNFSVLVNAGVAVSTGEVVVLLNDDVRVVAKGWLGALATVATGPRAGCVGALLLYPSGRVQHGGVVLGTFGVAGHAFRNVLPDAPAAAERLAAVHEVGAVTAACLAVRRRVFDAVGGFDASLPVTLNDVDFCLRVRARGYENLMAPHVRLEHHESASRGLDVSAVQAERLAEETARFLAKWGPSALIDPFYSPHRTLGREDGGVRDI